MTTDGEFFPNVWNLLCQLSSSHDNGQTMVIQPLGMKHTPSVDIAHDNGQSMIIYP